MGEIGNQKQRFRTITSITNCSNQDIVSIRQGIAHSFNVTGVQCSSMSKHLFFVVSGWRSTGFNLPKKSELIYKDQNETHERPHKCNASWEREQAYTIANRFDLKKTEEFPIKLLEGCDMAITDELG